MLGSDEKALRFRRFQIVVDTAQMKNQKHDDLLWGYNSSKTMLMLRTWKRFFVFSVVKKE